MDVLEPVLETYFEEMLELAGRTVFEAPEMTDNVTVDGVARTVAATQFPPTPGSSGHGVTFFREDARTQWACFFESNGRLVRSPREAAERCR
ncbi:MAG: hypothetical protein ACYTF3_00465 [Planctomycetota bacterium]|jgi:hypothetical protein